MSETGPVFDAAFREKLASLMHWRRDVRRFRRDPVDWASVEECLRIACQGPSVGNSQPWRFIRVEDPARQQALRQEFESANAKALAGYEGERAHLYASLKLSGLDDAPLQVSACSDGDAPAGLGLGSDTMPEVKAYSVVAAIQTLWLLLRSRGIGLGWVSIFDPCAVKRVLGVPPEWTFLGHLCIGYPEEETDIPELVSAGWQERLPFEEMILKR
jgi:5,6-dimethylbenzimidazole synthase